MIINSSFWTANLHLNQAQTSDPVKMDMKDILIRYDAQFNCSQRMLRAMFQNIKLDWEQSNCKRALIKIKMLTRNLIVDCCFIRGFQLQNNDPPLLLITLSMLDRSQRKKFAQIYCLVCWKSFFFFFLVSVFYGKCRNKF